MGFYKEILAQDERRRSIAITIAIGSGVLKTCEYHGEVYLADEFIDPLPAYMRAASRFKRGEFHDMFESQLHMTDEIRETVNEFGWDECPRCWKLLQ